MEIRQSSALGVSFHDCIYFYVRLLLLGAGGRLQQNRLGHLKLLSVDLHDDLLLSLASSTDWPYPQPAQMDSVPHQSANLNQS
jgi:hypothetical protein